jgi:hypothetical protein
MVGNDAQPWWAYTRRRKELLASDTDQETIQPDDSMVLFSTAGV